jgi:uncharacterized protein (DUF488 family)
MATVVKDPRSFAELTRSVFGEAMSVDQVFGLLDVELDGGGSTVPTENSAVVSDRLWVGSIGYERYRLNTDFVAQVARSGVERLIDVRQLPISRRRGFAKSALSEALAAVGIEYVHMRDLGNPKPTRDLYKSGRAAEGRAGYEHYLLSEQREALSVLAQLLGEKRCTLMCVEHDSTVCHRDVIFDALESEVGLGLEVADI